MTTHNKLSQTRLITFLDKWIGYVAELQVQTTGIVKWTTRDDNAIEQIKELIKESEK